MFPRREGGREGEREGETSKITTQMIPVWLLLPPTYILQLPTDGGEQLQQNAVTGR